jgi:hypothetical protein
VIEEQYRERRVNIQKWSLSLLTLSWHLNLGVADSKLAGAANTYNQAAPAALHLIEQPTDGT